MRRAMIVVGWIATVPGLAGLLAMAMVLPDAEWVLGCRPSGFLGLSCPDNPAGWLGNLLWFVGLMVVIGFPVTLIPMIYAVVYPIARLVIRRRAAARATTSDNPMPEGV